MKIKVTNEAKTGILVLVSLAVFGALILKVGNFALFKKGYEVKCQLHYSAGVKKHAPVRLSGVDVGEVRDIHILYGDQTTIELVFLINEGVKLRLDSKAYVTTLGLMGEKYIEIKAGTPLAEYAKPGDMIPGQDPIRLEDLIETATKVATDIGDMGRNISQTSKDVGKLVNHIDTAVENNKPKIDNIFTNLEDTSVKFKDFSQDIKFHPWKVLAKGKEKTRAEMDAETAKKKEERKKR